MHNSMWTAASDREGEYDGEHDPNTCDCPDCEAYRQQVDGEYDQAQFDDWPDVQVAPDPRSGQEVYMDSID